MIETALGKTAFCEGLLYAVYTYIGVTAGFSSLPGGIREVKLKRETVHFVKKSHVISLPFLTKEVT
jgi:hypothetical protein